MPLVEGPPVALPAGRRTPGDYWREVLAESLERDGSVWTVSDLLGAVAGCEASLVDVAGWLCDELVMGRVLPAADVPQHYELAPGVRSYRHRIAR
jgi:hypothetical protein